MSSAKLQLVGARKKAEPQPRTEGVTKRKNGVYYLRVYPPGAKRATYRSTRQRELRAAEALVPHLRAKLARPATPAPTLQPTDTLALNLP